jgi:hypothetical protein
MLDSEYCLNLSWTHRTARNAQRAAPTCKNVAVVNTLPKPKVKNDNINMHDLMTSFVRYEIPPVTQTIDLWDRSNYVVCNVWCGQILRLHTEHNCTTTTPARTHKISW